MYVGEISRYTYISRLHGRKWLKANVSVEFRLFYLLSYEDEIKYWAKIFSKLADSICAFS